MTRLTLGFSPCPNDTFMFHGLVTGNTPARGIEWDVELDDIAVLNQRAADHIPGRHQDFVLCVRQAAW